MKNKIFIVILLSNIAGFSVFSQSPIKTSCPILSIEPSAQVLGFGLVGVVASEYNYEAGLTQNPALLSRNTRSASAFISYKPWMRHTPSLFPEMSLSYLGGHYSINEKIALGALIRYFNLGKRTFYDISGSEIYTYNSNEFSSAFKAGYSITPELSLGAGFKYIRSNVTGGMSMNNHPTHIGHAVAADIGVDYRKKISLQNEDFCRYDLGASISNIGNKVSYSSNTEKDFLPTTLRLGAMGTYSKKINEATRYCIDFGYQIDKLLVPTPPKYEINNNGEYEIIEGYDPDVSVFKGMVQSFYDAPDGFSEEIHELIHYFGIENRIETNSMSFAIRLGHMNEHKTKGNRKNFTAGFGVEYGKFYFDFGVVALYKWKDSYDEKAKYVFTDLSKPYTWNLTLGFRNIMN